jgi:hypothetical protein
VQLLYAWALIRAHYTLLQCILAVTWFSPWRVVVLTCQCWHGDVVTESAAVSACSWWGGLVPSHM